MYCLHSSKPILLSNWSVFLFDCSKKKRRRRKRKKNNSDSSDGDRESHSKRGRKNIRKVIKVKDLELETKLAAKEEIQRRRRIVEREKKVKQNIRKWFRKNNHIIIDCRTQVSRNIRLEIGAS